MGWVGDEVMPVYVGVNAWLGRRREELGIIVLPYNTKQDFFYFFKHR